MEPLAIRKHHPLLSRIRGGVDGMAWPAVPIGLTATLVAVLHEMEDTQWLGGAELAAHQFRQLGLLSRHAATHSPLFRRRLESAGLRPEDLETPDGFRALPPLTRRDIQVAGPDLFCAEVPAGHTPVEEARTTGSTGTPVVVRGTPATKLMWFAMTMREHLWYDRDLSRGFTSIKSPKAPYSVRGDWGAPVSLLVPSGPMQMIPWATDIEQMAEWLLQFKPGSLLLLPTVLDGLTKHFARQGLSLPGLSDIRTIGETLSPRVRQEAERVFGARVIAQYSAAEVGSMAIECPESGLYHVMSESVIVEVLDDKGEPCREGEMGRVHVTSLHNFATPLIRYAVQDYAEPGGPCPCGRGLPTLKRIVGRERNLMLMPDGTRRLPLFSAMMIEQTIAPVAQFQFVQHEREKIELRLVAEQPVSRAQEAGLRKLLQDHWGYPFEISFTYFDREIPRGPGGKFEDFISKVV